MRLLALLSLLVPTATAGVGGPDSAGEVYTDSGTSSGPSYGWLDTSGGTTLSLGDDEVFSVALPFDFTFYGTDYSSAAISSNGALFFANPDSSGVGLCPGTATTAVGIAALWDDLGAGTITYDTFGTYPFRTFVVTWDGVPHATYGGAASFQVWLLEGRNEAVVQYDDITFGNAAVDDGANATVGTFSGSTGLPWSCSTAFAAGAAVWFGDETARPARADVYADELDTPWSGPQDFSYSGSNLLAADINLDGDDDLLVGSPSDGAGFVTLLYRPGTTPTTLDLGDSVFTGTTSGDSFGASIGVGDFDGDGVPDVAIGAPGSDASGTDAGVVFLYEGGAYATSLAASDADIALKGNSTGRSALGSSLSLLGDFDGDGYMDLVSGAPNSDDVGTDSGSVYILDGGASLAGAYTSASTSSRVTGGASGDKLGTSLAVDDVDGDGLDDLAVGAPYQDSGATNGGAVYLIYGTDLPTGGLGVSAVASCRTTLSQAQALLGSSVGLGDVGGSTGPDLLLGAPYYDSGSADIGGVFVFNDLGSTCVTTATSADTIYKGQTTSGRFGSSIAVGDVDGDAQDDLLAGAVNDNSYSAGGGVAYTFTTRPSGSLVTAADADHALYGTWSGGRAGSAIVVAEGNVGRSLLVTAPYANEGGTSTGAMVEWPWHNDFEDDDADGFVNGEAGGNDCDDQDATAFPGGTDTFGDSVDGDCDGWIDGEIRVRDDEDNWAWDVDSISGSVSTSLDFETSTVGDPLDTLGGVTFTGTTFDDQTSRAWPVGAVGVTVTGGVLTMAFDTAVDGLSFRWLDPDDSFELVAYDSSGGVVVTGYDADLQAPSRAQGIYRGYLFIESVSSVTITAAGGDTFGFDELELVSALDTDRDRDGQTENAGDCDDTDATIYTGATEVLGNSIDDDCDGVVDGGALTVWTDSTSWTSAAGLVPEQIDFEDLTDSDTIDTQYTSLGATFDGTPFAAGMMVDTPATGTLAADAASESLTLTFTEVQPAVGFTVLDLDDVLTIEGYVAGVLVYSSSFTGTGGSDFVGLTAEYGFDELVLTTTLTGLGDTWGVDDVIFSSLGLDDSDGDGLTERDGDCDDTSAASYTGATETWYDGIDEDCGGEDDYDQDFDGVELSSDCSDTDATAYPGATETWYDGVDSDCSGGSDDDQDGDGHDSSAAGGDDCDDTDATISPDATETYYDGVDQDCAGDDDYDADHDGYRSVGGSAGGDCDDTSAAVSPGATETYYDGVDNDCDTTTVDDDQDNDGYIGEASGGNDCEDGNALAYPGAPSDTCYDGVDQDCDGSNDYDCDADGYTSADHGGDDCDDSLSSVHPGATDSMGDGVDSDCNGGPDYDFDYDGFDAVANGGTDCDDTDATVYLGASDTCYDGVDSNCDTLSDNDCDVDGYDDLGHGGTDCDDADGTINPGALDFPYDGIDNDCDGASEYDLDGDGHLADWYGGDDCDDADSTVYPGAIDACYDGEDTDCGGDDDYDCDGDTYESDLWGGADCDDTTAAVSPAVPEIAGDGIDQDCDGVDPSVCTDCDEDGVLGVASGGTDCDDTSATAYPGAPDADYDGVDSDCAGDNDFDADGDGDAVEAGGGSDCNDADPLIAGTNSVDDCGGGDEDCDGTLDEDCLDQDTGTIDTGTIDTGETGATGDSGDSGDDWRPEADTVDAPRTIDRGTVCGCDTTPGASAGVLGFVMAAGVLARRKRRA